METLSHLIEIVFDKSKKKLRARSIVDGHWCRFPNHLRQENKIYKASKMTKSTGDSWIAGGQITPFDLTNEKNPELEQILLLKNKAVLKQFYDVLFNPSNKKVNTEMLNIVFLIKKIFPTIDEQLLLPVIKSYTHSAFICEDLLIPLKNMLSTYNEKRVVQLFSVYEEDDFLEDTTQMYERLFRNNLDVDAILPDKPKNIRELHTIFSRECSKISIKNNALGQHRKLGFLDSKIFNEDLSFYIPETTHDLITIGNQLSICVGNGLYAKKVLEGRCNIIALKSKDNKFKYCIELANNKIIQARGFGNRSMTNKEMDQIIEILKNSQKEAA